MLGAAFALASVGGERLRADAQDGEGPRLADLRRQPGAAGLLQPRRQGQLDRPRRRFLPRDRGGDLQRSEQGQVHAALGQGPVRAAQIRRDRCALAQHDLDPVARRALQFRRRHLLRRPGLHGAQGAQGQFGARAQRRLGLHADRHHDRAQSRRLFPRQQHEVRGDRVRDRRTRPSRPTRPAAATSSPPTCRSSMPRSSSSPTPTTT